MSLKFDIFEFRNLKYVSLFQREMFLRFYRFQYLSLFTFLKTLSKKYLKLLKLLFNSFGKINFEININKRGCRVIMYAKKS